MGRYSKIFSFLLILLFSANLIWAKAPEKTSQTGAEQPSGTKGRFDIEALNVYPLAIRKAILEVVLHPHLFQEVLKIQQGDSQQLKNWIKGFGRSVQNQVYQVARFPKLINELVAGGSKNHKQIKQILRPYPKEVHKAARYLVGNQWALLQKINDLNFSSNQQFEKLIKNYPPQTRKAYHVVLQHPVILHILARNNNYAYLLGKIHGSDYPDGKNRLKQVGKSARRKDQVVAATQKRELFTNPQAKKLEAAANNFVKKANAPLDKVLDPKKAVQVTATFDPIDYPYLGVGPTLYSDPYWYGFPDWEYPYDWW